MIRKGFKVSVETEKLSKPGEGYCLMFRPHGESGYGSIQMSKEELELTKMVIEKFLKANPKD